MKKVCLVLEPNDFSECALRELSRKYDIICEKLDFVTDYESIEVIFCRLKYNLNADFLKRFTGLKYICAPTTGTDHIDTIYCVKHGITIVSLKGESTFLYHEITSTAEYTWALMLSTWRKVVPAALSVLEGKWDRDKFKYYQLKGRNLGIIGMGRIGNQLKKYADAFELNFRYFDPYVLNLPGKMQNLQNLASWSDIIIIACEYNADTRHLIDRKFLSYLNDGNLIINTARGDIVDDEALVEVLLSKKIFYSADVVSNEQDNNKFETNKLLKLTQVSSQILITPHIAGASYDAMKKTEEFIVGKLFELLSKQYSKSEKTFQA